MSRYGMSAALVLQNAATASGNGTPMSVDGYATLLVSVVSSVAMSGGTTVNFEASTDNTNWTAISGTKIGASPTSTSTTTADGDFRFNVSGYRKFRARISGYSAGTTTITAHGTMAAGTDAAIITTGDVEIGAVELKNSSSDDRASVDTGGALLSKEKRAATSTVTSQNDQNTNVTLLAANTARLGCRIVNDSTVVLYLKYGATATTSDYSIKLAAGDTLIEDLYTGKIDGIWASDASGAAKITELTA